MIASLPMYDRPENAAAHDELWHLIRRHHGGELPETLTRGTRPEATWAHPELALGQICGLPLRTSFRDKVELIGTLDYGVENAPAGHYVSVLVIRGDDRRRTAHDFDGARIAVNARDSQSGWAAPSAWAAEAGISFGAVRETGGHRRSALAVARSEAEVAALDIVTWRAIARHDAFASGLKVFAATPPRPGLALIAASGADAERMFVAVSSALSELSRGAADSLGVRGLVRVPVSEYHAVLDPAPA